jgi:hypothetical protein
MELAVDDFSGGELVEELILSWLEIIELVITFFCCKNNYVLLLYGMKLCICEKSCLDSTTFQRHSTVPVQCF